MSARALFCVVLIIAAFAANTFGEEQKRDERNNPKSPQYKEYADLSKTAADARLSLPEACQEILSLFIVQRQVDPARFTPEISSALRDCEKFYLRIERYWLRAHALLREPNLMNDEEKLARCKAIVAKLTECAPKFKNRWEFLVNALTGDEWKSAEEEADRDEAAEKEESDKDK